MAAVAGSVALAGKKAVEPAPRLQTLLPDPQLLQPAEGGRVVPGI
jgi:hypothetical protein